MSRDERLVKINKRLSKQKIHKLFKELEIFKELEMLKELETKIKQIIDEL